MLLFAEVPVYCNNCGFAMTTQFSRYDGRVCNTKCWNELQDKRVASLMGEEWKPKEIRKG